MATPAKSNGKGVNEDIPANLKRGAANAGQPSYEELMQRYEALAQQNEALKVAAAAKQASLKLKVSEKGAVSLYGLGRFPVTLYASSFIRLLDMADEIRTFIDQNKDRLSFK